MISRYAKTVNSRSGEKTVGLFMNDRYKTDKIKWVIRHEYCKDIYVVSAILHS
jgi:hypothetical protein